MIIDRPDGMLKTELEVLTKLIQDFKPKDVLEIGLANASSALIILEIISNFESSSLTSIDPFQNFPIESEDDSYGGYAGKGILNIKNAGFLSKHHLIEELSYLALPELVKQHKKYDLILIDGYHSFDYTFVDFFYSDLLLKDGGIIIIHDTNWETVYPVCQFVIQNKQYKQIGPRIEHNINSILGKIYRRLKYFLTGNYQEFTLRKDSWKSVGAFQKLATTICPEQRLNGIKFR